MWHCPVATAAMCSGGVSCGSVGGRTLAQPTRGLPGCLYSCLLQGLPSCSFPDGEPDSASVACSRESWPTEGETCTHARKQLVLGLFLLSSWSYFMDTDLCNGSCFALRVGCWEAQGRCPEQAFRTLCHPQVVPHSSIQASGPVALGGGSHLLRDC